MSDGTGAPGHLAKSNADGSLTDNGNADSYAADTGAANAYAVTLAPAITLTVGDEIRFLAAHANTGAATLALNGGPVVAIKKAGVNALAPGDIAAGQIVIVVYDGTNFQLVAGANLVGGAATGVYMTETPAGTLNGTNVTFTLSHTPVAGSLIFTLNGNKQELSRWYTISGTTITMTVAPISIDRLVATYQY